MSEKLFYVQDSRQMVGNCMSWWCPDGRGYTSEIGKAGLYPLARIERMRDTDIPWPKEIVEEAVVRHVRADRIKRSVSLELKSWIDIRNHFLSGENP